jgi:hypothetical protein
VDSDAEVKGASRRGHDIAAPNRGTLAHEDPPDESIRRAQAAGVVDAHEQVPGDRSRESDHTIAGRANDRAVGRVVFDAAVSRTVRTVGGPERVEHRCPGRRRERRGRGICRIRDDQHDGERENRACENRHTTPL